jgi:hypothetical protein
MTTGLPVQVPIDVLGQFERVTDYWSPKVIAHVNDQYVKIARLLGEMDWHSHAHEDELFWVLRGRLRLEFRDGVAELAAGQCCGAWNTTRSRRRSAGSCWWKRLPPGTPATVSRRRPARSKSSSRRTPG